MRQDSDAIVDSRLFQQLDRLTDYDHLTKTDIAQLSGLIIDVGNYVAPQLSRIAETFHQYTEHNLQHICNVADLAYAMLPKRGDDDGTDEQDGLVRLNALEVSILWLGILLHDAGMFVGDKEKAQLKSSEEYADFLRHNEERTRAAQESREHNQLVNATLIDDALFAEFIRQRHARRVRGYLEQELNPNVPIRFRTVSLIEAIATLCESHAWGVRESHDPRNIEHAVCHLPRDKRVSSVRVNLQYLACILRLADILDFDRTRTPLSVYRHIDFTERRSLLEWNKHLTISGWRVDERGVAYSAECLHPVYYVAVQDFLNSVDTELKECRFLVDASASKSHTRYALRALFPKL